MGLFRRRPKDLVHSTAVVTFAALTSKAARQTDKLSLDHEVRLRVHRPDVGEVDVSLVCRVPHGIVLTLGADVPVWISASDPDFLEIDFDGVVSLEDVGLAAAEAAREGRPFNVADALGQDPRQPPC